MECVHAYIPKSPEELDAASPETNLDGPERKLDELCEKAEAG